jgi:hypothetical protein
MIWSWPLVPKKTVYSYFILSATVYFYWVSSHKAISLSDPKLYFFSFHLSYTMSSLETLFSLFATASGIDRWFSEKSDFKCWAHISSFPVLQILTLSSGNSQIPESFLSYIKDIFSLTLLIFLKLESCSKPPYLLLLESYNFYLLHLKLCSPFHSEYSLYIFLINVLSIFGFISLFRSQFFFKFYFLLLFSDIFANNFVTLSWDGCLAHSFSLNSFLVY